MAAATEHVDHPLVVDGVLEERQYQREMADTAGRDHTLVCLPTGLGKTTVSLLVTAERFRTVGGRALLLAPTKPLVEQHATFYREALAVPDEEIVVFTGATRPDDRADLWADARVVVATPQVVENDLVGSRVSLAGVTHVTFDECHRATGDYAYNYIAERYHADAENPLVTGMSASPGGDEEEILQVCENLGIREVEVMTEADADVREHTYRTTVDWERVELPDEVLDIRDALQDVVAERLTRLKELGVTGSTDPNMSQKQLNAVRARLQELVHDDQSKGYEGMSIHAEVMKLRRAVELVETQAVESLRRYFERQRQAARSSGASKASQRFVSEPTVKEAMRRAEAFDDLHPKFRRARVPVAETLGIRDGERVIVFTESRDTAEALTDFLGEHFETRRFVGQGDKEGSDGMTQTEQQEVLERFRAGEFEVLVSTSVAEEGLDVPDVDLVLFYEPVPKGIRSIQRKGRTGRAREGRVVVLIAEDTRDEAFFWKSKHEEDRMEEELRKLKDVAGEITAALGGRQQDVEAVDGSDAQREPVTETNESETESVTTADTDEDESESTAGASEDESGRELTVATNGGGKGDDRQSGLSAFAGGDDEGGEETATEPGDDGESGDVDDQERDDEAVVARAGVDGADESDESDDFDDPDQEAVEVVADQREMDANVARDLSKRDGLRVRLETLEVGDYVLSDRVVVERKTVPDFLDTLVGEDERSVFEQVGDAGRHYSRPVVVLEGEHLYDARNVHPNAIRGALASLAVDFGVSVMQTAGEDETADLLAVVARREQEREDREVRVHGEKSTKTLAEQQEYVVASIAEVGPVTARALLEHFGSVEAVMTAGMEDLLDVEGVGEVTADRIREVVASRYEGERG